MYNNEQEKAMLELLRTQLKATWYSVYLLIGRQPARNDQWKFDGKNVWLNGQLIDNPDIVELFKNISQLKKEINYLEGGDDNGAV
ncbi:hypothetical protein [Thermoflavimicrobium dichotomicum]|uniref:Uncharacterized protein n=1 Tax=Thermoflavimicrobium dichotomicum TaxID=46223 RepID=A0A1I3UGT1_9BACL|nr:hypothetical protein [Thermoflavimicrobium dichotomicum]SFJ82718.1 hypothetical protein SAMN05421852_12519 [Thermoflavimicrobium dichotomicum]